MDVAIIPGRRQPATGWVEGDRGDQRPVVREGVEFLPRVRVPDLDTGPARGQVTRVRAEGNTPDHIVMPLKGPLEPSRAGIPELDGLVMRGRSEPAPVGACGNPPNARLMTARHDRRCGRDLHGFRACLLA